MGRVNGGGKWGASAGAESEFGAAQAVAEMYWVGFGIKREFFSKLKVQRLKNFTALQNLTNGITAMFHLY